MEAIGTTAGVVLLTVAWIALIAVLWWAFRSRAGRRGQLWAMARVIAWASAAVLCLLLGPFLLLDPAGLFGWPLLDVPWDTVAGEVPVATAVAGFGIALLSAIIGVLWWEVRPWASARGPSGMVIRVAIWTPIALLCWYAFFFGLDLQLFYPLPTGLLIIAAIVAMGINRHRAVGQAALLELMAAAVERGIPLASAARAFGGERRGRLGRRARRLAELLDAGMPLREALKAVPRLLPPQAAVLLCVGSDAGALAPALRQATAARIVCEPIWQVTLPKLCYVCFMPFLATGLFIFIAIKIIPQFEKIFKDFGTRLAPMTQALIDAGCWIANYWYLTPLPWVLAAIGGLLIYLGLRYAGLIGWDLPGMGWIVRRLDTAAVLDALALAAGRQRPIDQAIATLAECYPKPPIRRRLAAVLAEVRGGADWCRSLRRHGLVRQADMAVLESAARAGNLPWALGEMADSNRRRFTYRAYAAVQLAFPPIVLAYGLVVALVVVALFLPLIQLIRSLA